MTRVIVLSMLAAAACQHSEDRYLQREVKPEELAGVWAMTPESVPVIRGNGYAEAIDPQQHNVTFRSDGTCRFQTFAGVLRSATAPVAPPVDRECTWTLDPSGPRQEVTVQMTGEPPLATRYHFRRTEIGALSLWQFAGDPDAGRYIEYVKR